MLYLPMSKRRKWKNVHVRARAHPFCQLFVNWLEHTGVSIWFSFFFAIRLLRWCLFIYLDFVSFLFTIYTVSFLFYYFFFEIKCRWHHATLMIIYPSIDSEVVVCHDSLPSERQPKSSASVCSMQISEQFF